MVGIRSDWYILFLLVHCLAWSSCADNRDAAQAVLNVNAGLLPLCTNGVDLLAIDKLSQPQRREGIGTSHIGIATSIAEAQEWFDQGLNLLHGFWYLEAYRAFQQVIKIDPNCAMGYWGVAMCQAGFGGEMAPWQKAISKAVELESKTSTLERSLIIATDALLKNGVKHAVPHFQSVASNHNDSPDAIAFAALFERQIASSDSEIEKVIATLEDALERFPDHVGLLHYYIHIIELGEDFKKAMPFATDLVNSAPSVPHLLHMPGHIYFLEGAYEQAAIAFETAKNAEENYQVAEKISPALDQNYLHNLHFLAVTYSELDDYERAIDVAEIYSNIALKNPVSSKSSELLLNYKGRIMPALVDIRFGNYKAATAHLNFWLTAMNPPTNDQLTMNYLKAMQEYCIGMQAVLLGDEAAGINASKNMKNYISAYENAVGTDRSGEDMRHVHESYDIMMMAWYELVGWGVNMNAEIAFIPDPWNKAFELEEAIPYAEPPRLIYPIGESLTRLHLIRDEHSLAKQASDRALKKRHNSPRIQALLASTTVTL